MQEADVANIQEMVNIAADITMLRTIPKSETRQTSGWINCLHHGSSLVHRRRGGLQIADFGTTDGLDKTRPLRASTMLASSLTDPFWTGSTSTVTSKTAPSNQSARRSRLRYREDLRILRDVTSCPSSSTYTESSIVATILEKLAATAIAKRCSHSVIHPSDFMSILSGA